MQGNRRIKPVTAAPLQRTVTLTNTARAGQPRRAGQRGALSSEHTEAIARQIDLVRTQTGLSPAAFAAAVDAIVHGEPVSVPRPPTERSLDDRVAAAQRGSAAYVRRWGIPCNMVLGIAYMPAIAYIGAVMQYARLGLTAQVRNWAGAAVGGLIAALLAAGLTTERLAEIAVSSNFAKITRVGRFPGQKLMRRHGFLTGRRFVKWFKGILRAAIVDENITLQGLHELRGGRLVIAATNLTEVRPVYIDYRTHPDMPLWMAARISVSAYPVVAPAVWGGIAYADAGVLSGMPMDAFYFNDTDCPVNQRTIGLLAVCDGVSSKPADTLGAKMAAVADVGYAAVQRTAMDAQDRERTVVIQCGRMSSYDFSMSRAAREALIDLGATAVVNQFADGVPVIADKWAVASNGFDPADEPEAQSAVQSVLEKGKERMQL